MRVQIDDAKIRLRMIYSQKIRPPAETGKGNFVPAAHTDGEKTLLQQLRDLMRKLILRGFQTIALTDHIACVNHALPRLRGNIGQEFAQHIRRSRRADSPMIARHACIASKANECDGIGLSLMCVAQRLDDLMPARAQLAFEGVGASLPQFHVGWIFHAHLSLVLK